MQPERLSIWGQQMTGYGPALRRRMRAMGMVELRVDHVVDGIQTHCETRHQACRRQTNGQTQTCVSRTFGVAHQNLARLVHVSCFMFHERVPSRRRAFEVVHQIWRDRSMFHVSCFRNVFRRAANRQLANFKERGLTKMSKARHC
jgi:hypothetical protein